MSRWYYSRGIKLLIFFTCCFTTVKRNVHIVFVWISPQIAFLRIGFQYMVIFNKCSLETSAGSVAFGSLKLVTLFAANKLCGRNTVVFLTLTWWWYPLPLTYVAGQRPWLAQSRPREYRRWRNSQVRGQSSGRWGGFAGPRKTPGEPEMTSCSWPFRANFQPTKRSYWEKVKRPITRYSRTYENYFAWPVPCCWSHTE